MFAEKESIERMYNRLMEEHKATLAKQEELVSDRDEAVAQTKLLRQQMEGRRNEKSDIHLRAELDRVRSEL